MGRPKTKPRSTHIRIPNPTKIQLQELSKKEKKSMSDLLSVLVTERKRRGQLTEIATVFIVLLLLSITLMVTWVASDAIFDGLGKAGYNDTAEARATFNNLDNAAKMGDTWITLLAVGLSLFLFILAVLLPTNIIFSVIYTMGVMFVWIISVIVANIWNSWGASSSMALAIAGMPATNTLLSNLPTFATGLVMVLLVVFYGKNFFTG